MRAAAAAVAALALAPLAAAGTKNACLLVRGSDVSSALHAKVGVAGHKLVGGFDTCIWKSGKVSVTVKTRPLSHGAYRSAVKKIPGVALEATDISADAWVFFVANGTAMDDWKAGNEIGFVIVGAGANAVPVLKALGKAARARL